MADFTRDVGSGALVTTWIRRQAIRTLENNLVLGDYVTPGEMPPNSGDTYRWTLDDNLTTATVYHALTNDDATAPDQGAPGSKEITYDNRANWNRETWNTRQIEKRLHVYGSFLPVRTTDLDEMPRGMMDRIQRRFGYRGNLTVDSLLRATCDGTGTAANGFYPQMGAGTDKIIFSRSGAGGDDGNLDVDDLLSADDVANGTTKMREDDVMPFSNGMYALVIHSTAEGHIITDVSTNRLTWSEINKYVSGSSGQLKLPKGEVGAIAGTMVVRSNNISTGVYNVDKNGFNNILLGQEGLGNVTLHDSQPRIYINRPNAGSTDNPYRIYSTVSFRFRCGPTLIDAMEDSGKRVALLVSATGS